MKCEYCGCELNPNSKICTYCGAPNPNYTDVVASSTNPIKEPSAPSFENNSNVNTNYYNPTNSKNNTKTMATIIAVMCVLMLIFMVIFGIKEKNGDFENNYSNGFFTGWFESDDDYVATYDNGEITKKEFAVYYYLYGEYMTGISENETETIENVIYRALEDELLYNKAIKANIVLTQDQKEHLDYIFDSEAKGIIEGINLDYNTFKEIYERDYYIQNYVDKEAENFADEDVLDYLETTYDKEDLDLNEYNIQVIYYENEQSAQNMLKNIKEGANFDEMVKFSENEASINENGIVACYDDGQVSDDFLKAIKTLSAGDVYDGVLEADDGYCVVKMVSIVEKGRVNNIYDREDLFYATFESEIDLSNTYYYEETAKSVIKSLNIDN